MGLDEKVYKPGMVQARISNAKNHLVSPAGYANNKEAYEGDRAAKVPALRDIYQRYWERCRQADAMDFDDCCSTHSCCSGTTPRCWRVIRTSSVTFW